MTIAIACCRRARRRSSTRLPIAQASTWPRSSLVFKRRSSSPRQRSPAAVVPVPLALVLALALALAPARPTTTTLTSSWSGVRPRRRHPCLLVEDEGEDAEEGLLLVPAEATTPGADRRAPAAVAAMRVGPEFTQEREEVGVGPGQGQGQGRALQRGAGGRKSSEEQRQGLCSAVHMNGSLHAVQYLPPPPR